jgi:hypothetical protein
LNQENSPRIDLMNWKEESDWAWIATEAPRHRGNNIDLIFFILIAVRRQTAAGRQTPLHRILQF